MVKMVGQGGWSRGAWAAWPSGVACVGGDGRGPHLAVARLGGHRVPVEGELEEILGRKDRRERVEARERVVGHKDALQARELFERPVGASPQDGNENRAQRPRHVMGADLISAI